MRLLDLNVQETALMLGIHRRTLNDWVNEKFNISHKAAKILSEKSNIDLPKNTIIINWNGHLRKIARSGGVSRYKKYGKIALDEDARNIAWKNWWKQNGQFKKIAILERRKIKKPLKCKELAEFFGIMMGDGGMAEYHLAITLNSDDDREYGLFVSKLIKKLFNVEPRIYKRKNALAIDLVIHRIELVDFLTSLGLKRGNKLKQGLDMPQWIKTNAEYRSSCLRGLMDTDGSVFQHSYRSRNKKYSYVKISFKSSSLKLLKTARQTLNKVGIRSRIAKGNNDLRIESIESVKKYIELIGTNNLKHKRKLNKLWRVAPNGKAAVC